MTIFLFQSKSRTFETDTRGQNAYKNDIPDENKADCCVECGTCETLCPQDIEIIAWLKKSHAYLTQTGE